MVDQNPIKVKSFTMSDITTTARRAPMPFTTATFAPRHTAPLGFVDTRVLTHRTLDPFRDAVFFTTGKAKASVKYSRSTSAIDGQIASHSNANPSAPNKAALTPAEDCTNDNNILSQGALSLSSLQMSPITVPVGQCGNPSHNGICRQIAHLVRANDDTYIRAEFKDCEVNQVTGHVRMGSGDSFDSFTLMTPHDQLSMSTTALSIEPRNDLDPVIVDTFEPMAKTHLDRFKSVHSQDYTPGRFIVLKANEHDNAPPNTPVSFEADSELDIDFRDTFDLFARYGSVPTYVDPFETRMDLAEANKKLGLYLEARGI